MGVLRLNWRFGALALGLGLAACTPVSPALAPLVAEPNTAAARNFTSFNDALRCMDRLLATAGKSPILVSSTGIPDRTRRINVSADDMLVNAINQMNRTSKRIVFVDQPLEKKDGQIIYLTRDDKTDATPRYLFRGAISQLDDGVSSSRFSLTANNAAAPLRPLQNASLRASSRLSVVSVDMHLVRYPERTVVAGASVANSMVVRRTGGLVAATGLIDLTRLGFSIQIDRVESAGQAVRNLIELGAIELVGRLTGLPYWTCLGSGSVASNRAEQPERRAAIMSDSQRVAEAQQGLRDLGYYAGAVSGKRDSSTRQAIAIFQADENLIASGEVDWDLLNRIRRKLAARKPPAAEPAQQTQKSETKGKEEAAGDCPLGTTTTGTGCKSDQEILRAFLTAE